MERPPWLADWAEAMEGIGEPYGRRMADTARVVEERVANEDGVENAWWAEELASDVSPPTEVTRRGFTLSIERTVPEGEAGGGRRKDRLGAEGYGDEPVAASAIQEKWRSLLDPCWWGGEKAREV